MATPICTCGRGASIMVDLESYVRKRMKAENKGLYKVLLEIYRDIGSNKIVLIDPKPPRNILEYITRLDYSLWAWVIIVASILLLITNIIGYPLLQIIRIPVGLIYIFFVPGYLVLQLVHTERELKELSNLEELMLSIGLSIAITTLLGLILNYTVFGVNVLSLSLTLVAIVFILLIMTIRKKYSELRD